MNFQSVQIGKYRPARTNGGKCIQVTIATNLYSVNTLDPHLIATGIVGLLGRSTKGRRTAKSSIYCSSDHFSEAKFHKALQCYETSHQINPMANPNKITPLFCPIRNLFLMDHLFLLDCFSSDNEQDVCPL
jgi:hypothetical protein